MRIFKKSILSQLLINFIYFQGKYLQMLPFHHQVQKKILSLYIILKHKMSRVGKIKLKLSRLYLILKIVVRQDNVSL